MMRKLIATVALIAAAGVSVGSVAAVKSQPSNPPAALRGGDPVSALEATTVREPRRGRPMEPMENGVITAHARKLVDGEPWKIVAYHSTRGALCAGVTWPGEGQEMGCASRAEWFARGPISVSVGARQASGQPLEWQTIVISGLADTRRVARLEMVSTDCSSRAIPLDESGFFLDVTPSASIERDAWPYELFAYDGNGRVLQQTSVRPSAPDTKAAHAAGVVAPAADAACA